MEVAPRGRRPSGQIEPGVDRRQPGENPVLKRVETRHIEIAVRGHPPRLHQLGVVFGEPRDQEIESALAALGADVIAPSGPASHELAEAHEPDDVPIGCVLEQAMAAHVRSRGPSVRSPDRRRLNWPSSKS